jgi:tetratricopeptide (TPR) repeat protein
MKNHFLFLFCALVSFYLRAQIAQTYENARSEIHLCGPITLADLQDSAYVSWYNQSYQGFELSDKPHKWSKNLKGTEVEIYMGTWCGDSRNWVPAFVRLWDELGLDKSQLKLIALYDGEEKYKQGPNGEEKGKNVHRVPTFIFKKEGEEYAQIIESPSNDLETDLAQIALGYPSEPNYAAATYMIDLLENNSKEDRQENFKMYLNAAYKLASKSGELNTLGYFYLYSGRTEDAITIFKHNMFFFRHEPNVYDSYAEALAIGGYTEEAIKYYGKVLELDPDNENALAQIEKLKSNEG